MRSSRPITGWKPSTPPIASEELSELVSQHSAIAVHFWASWNGIDVLMDESVRAVIGQFEGRVYFTSCEIDLPENRELCDRCRFENIPAMGLFVGNQVSRPIIGLHSAEQLTREIEKRLAEPNQPKPWWAFWRT